MLDKRILYQLQEMIKDANGILIVAPDSPDGDSVGSNLALFSVWQQMDKQVFWYGDRGNDPGYNYIKGNELCQFSRNLDQIRGRFDLVFHMDAGSLQQFEKTYQANPWLEDIKTVTIDHHGSRGKEQTDLMIIDPKAASNTILVLDIIEALDWPIDKQIAEYLMIGIYSDTAGFVNANTDARAYASAARLMQYQVDPHRLYREFIEGQALDHVSLTRLHKIMSSNVIKRGIVAYAHIDNSDIQDLDPGHHISHRVMSHLDHLRGVKIRFVVSEVDTHQYKISFRSTTDYDISKVAEKFSGGGHKVAAGAKLVGPETVEQAAEQIYQTLIVELGIEEAQIKK
ncbi:DHH family phosphoesterase [Candidatus Saccharibacteria bacterium]|nr:DHH family phosphoesterase [Candidatus Saccharibacteria bacterium]